MSNKTSADLVKEYVLDHYRHFGFLPHDVEVNGTVFDYGTYNLMLDLFFPKLTDYLKWKHLESKKSLLVMPT